jgi:OmpA family/PEGA domain
MRRTAHFLTLVLAVALCAVASFAQDGKLKVKVTPSQAYVYVDGKSLDHEGSRTVSLSAGKHTVAVVNYGYKMETREVNIDAGKTTTLEVALTAYGGPVNGPWGRVYLGGTPHAAVTSNGKTPAYHVGHVDEFNNDWEWKQELILPVGTYHLTVTKGGNTIWEGDVNIQANKKVSVNLANGTQKTTDWPRGEHLKDLPRFKAGIASATVAVAPVSGNFAASPLQINCGQSSNLNWQTNETVEGNIANVGTVAPTGSQSVSPKATTTYDYTFTGPGGKFTGSKTVEVNTKVDASLTANPTEVHYHKIGDKVVSQDSTTLTWTTSNAQSVTLDGNNVDPNGSQTVQVTPQDSSTVAEGQPAVTVDETKTYTLNASNTCGGSSTQTAPVHIVGSREPVPAVLLQSVFYPTDYPDKRHPQVGLVKSQELELATLAAGFKKYLEYDPDSKLSVEAYADIRGSKNYNQDLSERRVERIKQYLIEQGVAADKVQTAAYGKERPLEKKVVKELEETNPAKAPKARAKNSEGYWLAYNRRADIILLPSGKKSSQFYPNGAEDSGIIWQIPKAPLAKVEKAQ